MKDLMEHIKAENERTRQWVADDPKNRFASTWTEDEDHWREYGVETVEQFKRSNLVESLWDLYKEINGIRPRHIDFDSMTNEELGVMEDQLCEEMKAISEQEDPDELNPF